MGMMLIDSAKLCKEETSAPPCPFLKNRNTDKPQGKNFYKQRYKIQNSFLAKSKADDVLSYAMPAVCIDSFRQSASLLPLSFPHQQALSVAGK